MEAAPDGLFEALRSAQDEWYVRGRDKGVNLDLEVSIELAENSSRNAANADQQGDALNDLGIALQTLGQRETGTARLEQAVEAYTQALLEYTRDRVPLDWAMTQNNLGAALRTLGQRETGTARLEQAVEAYTQALLERTRDRVPLGWAATQFNIGLVEIAFFDKTGDAARLDAAERHVRAALEVFNEAGASQYIGMAESILNDIETRRST